MQKTPQMQLFRFCFCSLLKNQNRRKSEKTKSKKIGRLRKGARENSKIPKSFLFRISLNKKRQKEAVAGRAKNRT